MTTEHARTAFRQFAAACPHRLQPDLVRRPANALTMECGTPMDRCILKEPAHWVATGYGPRWIYSGGSPLVFGVCSMACALGQRWCTCGHREEAHRHVLLPHAGTADCMTDGGCPCDAYTATLSTEREENI